MAAGKDAPKEEDKQEPSTSSVRRGSKSFWPWKKEADGSASFLRAARAGNLDKVLEFLKTNTDINTCNANGLNALHLASKEGHSNVVAALIERKANVDSATKKGNTALHIASLAGQDEIVKVLVENNACVNIQSQNGFTPLYMAAQENHDSVVRYLLAHGANQSLATEDGFTPLAVALQQGHDRVVSVLLENDTRGKVRLPALHIAAKKDDAKAAALLLHTDHNPDITSKSGFTPLHIAAHYGNDNIAALLIQRGADVNYVAKHQITPLHVASKWGKGNMVSLLLDKGAHIEAKTRDGLTPLHCAARSGHETVVDMLLEKGAPITAKTKNGLAPLHMASQGDHVDAARILLYHKAPVDDVTVDFLTALHVAAHCGHVRVAKLLLDRKADPNSRALNGFTPLHIACKKNRIKVVELLLKHGASIESTTESGLTPLHVASFMGCMNIVIYLIQHGASADVPTVRGESPLHLAARANQTDIIRILLRNGAEVDAKAREQQTALHIASRLGNADIVGLLLQQGASPDAPTKDLYTPLHIAAKEGQEEVAGVLLDHGASLNTPTKKGFTPLHLAAKYGHMKVARLLLQREAPVDPKGKNGVTPLHVAAHYDHQNVAMLLLDKGAIPHATAKNGYTPLHIAARKNQMDIAGTLLEYGASANAESKAGFTPLHLSAQEGHTDMVTLLLEHGAQPGGAAKNGLTPLHLCAQEDRVPVGAILVKNGASIDPVTKAGYTPLHVASHFGQMNMVRFLIQHGTTVDASTQLGYTPLHQAAQQGHTQIVNLLLENKAQPNMETNDGKTALSIAQRLGYISVVETLKIVTETRVTTNTTTTTEEKYKVVVPETMHETFMSESEDEGADDTMLGDQSYRYLTVDEMKSLGDDSLPIDVTRDEKMDVSFQSTGTGGAPVDHISPQKKEMMYAQMYPTDNVDVGKAPILAGPESLNTTMNTTMNTSMNPADEESTQIINDESLQRVPDQGTTRSSHSPATVTPTDDSKLSHSIEALNGWEQFLVSFMVDARGGAMRGCRHSGVRVIIPPRKAAMPMRITCRYLKKDKLVHAPPLMEGEALASRILEMGPSGAKFLGPVIIEVPHFASLRGKEREIVILRSDNGETWREHTLEATEEAVQEVLNESFDGEELKQLEDLNTNRITRVLTTDFPQYFAIVTRIRQEVHAIGPEGGMVSSTVVPQVQAVFPQGALTKKIKVGLQAQPISTDLVAKLLGNRVAVSPIVTVEPRRRKFHKPITLTIPVPQAASKGMINQYSGDTPTLRLLCSITGGTTRAQWEDVTGSTPLTFVNDCVSFTTTVSARFWLMDCTNIPEATKMATELYREAIHVPFMAKFVVFSKRHAVEEARVRVFCMTDDKEDKTLETQEHFVEVAKSRDVEVLEGKSQYLEFGGNLVPVTKSGDQLAFNFYAFRENRLPFTVRVKDQNAEPVGRLAFMRQPKVGRGEAPQSPICNLNLSLPDNIQPEPAPSEPDLLALEKKYAFLSISKADTIHKADLRLSDISNMLAGDWVALAKALDISDSDINIIKSQYPNNIPQQAIVMLRLWMQLAGNRATGNTLEKGLRSIHRDDIVDECISNLEVVTDESEKAVAKERLETSPQKPVVVGEAPFAKRVDGSPEVSYDEKDIMKDAESADEEEESQRILQEREKVHKDMSPTYETEERKYAAEEKIFKEYEDKILKDQEIIGDQRKKEKSPPRDEKISPKDSGKPVKDEKISPKDSEKPPKDDNKSPKDSEKLPKDDKKSPKDSEKLPKDDRKSPKESEKPLKDDKKYVKEEKYSKEEKITSEIKTEETIKTKGREVEIETKEESFKETKEKTKEQIMEQFPQKKTMEKKQEEKETTEERKSEEKKLITKGEPTKPSSTPAPPTHPPTSEDGAPITEVITSEQRPSRVFEEAPKQQKEELLLKLGEELGKLDQKLEEKFKEKQKEPDGITQPSVEASQMVQEAPAPTDVIPPISAGGESSTVPPQKERVDESEIFDTHTDIETNNFKQTMFSSPSQELMTDLTLNNDGYVYLCGNCALQNEGITASNVSLSILPQQISAEPQRDFTKRSGTQTNSLSKNVGEALSQSSHRFETCDATSTGEANENETNDLTQVVRRNELRDGESLKFALENTWEVKTAVTKTVESHFKETQNVCFEEASVKSPVNSGIAVQSEPSFSPARSDAPVIPGKCPVANQEAKRRKYIASRKETVPLFSQQLSSSHKNKNIPIEGDVIAFVSEIEETTAQVKNKVRPIHEPSHPSSEASAETPGSVLELRNLSRAEKQEPARLPTITETGRETEEDETSNVIASEIMGSPSNSKYDNIECPSVDTGQHEIKDCGIHRSVPQREEIEAYPAVPQNQEHGTYPGSSQNQDLGSIPAVPQNQELGTYPTVPQNQELGTYPGISQNQDLGSIPAAPQNQELGVYPPVSQKHESNNFEDSHSTSLRTVVNKNAFNLLESSSHPVEKVVEKVDYPSGNQNIKESKIVSPTLSYKSKSGIDLKLNSEILDWGYESRLSTGTGKLDHFDRKCEYCAKDMLLNDVCNDISSLMSVVEEGIAFSRNIDVKAMLATLDILKFKVGRIFDFTFCVRPQSDIYFQSRFFTNDEQIHDEIDFGNTLFDRELTPEQGCSYIPNRERNNMPVIKEKVAGKQPRLIVSNEPNGQDFLTDTEEVFSEGDATPHVSPKKILKKNADDSDDEKPTDEESVEGSADENEDKLDAAVSVETLMPIGSQETLSFTEGYARTASPVLSDNESYEKQDIEGRHDKVVKRTIQKALSLEDKEPPQGNTDEENMSDSATEILEDEDKDTQVNLPDCYLQEGESVSDHEAVKSVSASPVSKSLFGSKKSRSSGKQQLLLEVQEEGTEGTTDVEEIPLVPTSKETKPKPKRKRPRRKKNKPNVPKVSTNLLPTVLKDDGATDTEILSGDKDSSTSSSESSSDFNEQYLHSIQKDLELFTDTEDVRTSDIDEGDLDSKPVKKSQASVIPEPYSEQLRISEGEHIDEPQVDTDEEGFNLDDKHDRAPLVLPVVEDDYVSENVVLTESDNEDDRLTDIDDVMMDDKEDEEIINDIIQRMPKEDTNILKEMDCQSDSVSNTKSEKENIPKGAGDQSLGLAEDGADAVTDIEEWDDKGGVRITKKKPYKPKQAKKYDTDTDSDSSVEDPLPPRIKGKKGTGRRLPLVPQVSEVKSVNTNQGSLSIVITPETFANKAVDKLEKTQNTFLGLEEESDNAATDVEDVASQDEMDESVLPLTSPKEPVTDTEDFESADISSKQYEAPKSPDISLLPSPKREKIHIVEDESGTEHVKIEKLGDVIPDIFAEGEENLTDSEHIDVTEDDALRMIGDVSTNETFKELPDIEPTEIETKTKSKRRKQDVPASVCDEGTDVEELLPGRKGKRRGRGKKHALEIAEDQDGNTDIEYLDEKDATSPTLNVQVDSPSNTDYEQFEASGEEECERAFLKDSAPTPELIRKAAVKRTVVYKERPGGTIRTEVQEEAPKLLKLSDEPSGLTDIEDVDVSEAEEAAEVLMSQDMCSSLPDNEESSVSVSVKSLVPHSKEKEEKEIKENLLLPEDIHGDHTDVESLDEGEETSEAEAYPDGSKTEATKRSPLSEVDLSVLESLLTSQEAEIEEMAFTQSLSEAETQAKTEAETQTNADKASTTKPEAVQTSPPPPPLPPPRKIPVGATVKRAAEVAQMQQRKPLLKDAPEAGGLFTSSDEGEEQLILMKDSPCWEEEEIQAEDSEDLRPIKAEIKLMVKTTGVGKEAIEIRSIREFVDPNEQSQKDADAKLNIISVENIKDTHTPEVSTLSGEIPPLQRKSFTPGRTPSPRFVRPAERFSYYEEKADDDFDLLAQVRESQKQKEVEEEASQKKSPK